MGSGESVLIGTVISPQWLGKSYQTWTCLIQGFFRDATDLLKLTAGRVACCGKLCALATEIPIHLNYGCGGECSRGQRLCISFS